MPITIYTPAELAATAKAEAEHVITAASTDAQLDAKANRIAHTTGTHAWVLGQIFKLQREIERQKAGETLPHLQNVEHRG